MKKALLITCLFLAGGLANYACPPVGIEESVTTETVDDDIEDIVIYKVEKQAEFKGGQQALINYLRDNIKYPEKALEAGIQGRVMVRFVVTKEGKVRHAKVVKGADPLLDEESLRVISIMPDWIPAENGGKKVNSYYTLPITFRLE